MTAEIGFGMYAAWSVTAFVLALFFAIAFAYRRRDVEFLLFALVCLGVGGHTLGIAGEHIASTNAVWYAVAVLANTSVLAAAAFNLHFVFRYARVRAPRFILWAIYGITVPLMISVAAGLWWQPESFHLVHGSLFGMESLSPVWDPTPWATVGYAFVYVEMLAALAFLYRAFRRGDRAAGWACIGILVIMLASANDMAIVLGLWSTVYLGGMAFIGYAFTIALTLPLRYRAAVSGLNRANEELFSSNTELTFVKDELEKKAALAAVGELSASIAHEVRTPLAIIINACANLKRAGVSARDQGTLVNIVEEESQRLDQLVTDLLRFAKPMNIEQEPTPLKRMIEESLEDAGARHGVEVSFDQTRIFYANVDCGLMPSVFKNLIENACQAMERVEEGEAKRVEVHAVSELTDGQEFVSISVRDTGHGMDEDTQRRARDPFFTTRPAGSGLGLAIVERIVEAHGGTLEIKSAPDVGTVVKIRLPAAIAPNRDLALVVLAMP
jgi:signal transduction histidine kinase